MKNLLLGAAGVILASTAATQGQSIQVTPVYVGYYSDTSLSSFTPAVAPIAGAGLVHQIDVRFSVTGLAPGQDFWTALFDVDLDPGLTAIDPGTGTIWNASGGTYDSNGAGFGGVQNHWLNGNNDSGTNANDLQAISVETTAAQANNRQYGEAVRPGAGDPDLLLTPTLLGTVFVQWNGTPGSVDINPIAGSPWGIFINNATGTGTTSELGSESFSGGSVQFGVIPEPAVIGVAGLASIGMLRRRRGA